MLSLLIQFDDPIERLLYGEPDEWLRLHEPRHYLPERHFHDRYWPGAQGDPDDPDIEPWYEVGDPPPGATLYGEHDRDWAERSGWGAEQTPEAQERYEEFQSPRDDIIQSYYDGDLSAEEYREALEQESQQYLSANHNTAPAEPAPAAAQSPTAAAASPTAAIQSPASAAESPSGNETFQQYQDYVESADAEGLQTLAESEAAQDLYVTFEADDGSTATVSLAEFILTLKLPSIRTQRANALALSEYQAIAEGGITPEELITLREKAVEGGEYDNVQINVDATDADGNKIPLRDADGNPVVDEENNPVYEKRPTTQGAWLRESVIPDTEAHHQLMDSNNAALSDYRAIAEDGITPEELATLREKAVEGSEYDQVQINVDATGPSMRSDRPPWAPGCANPSSPRPKHITN